MSFNPISPASTGINRLICHGNAAIVNQMGKRVSGREWSHVKPCGLTRFSAIASVMGDPW
ncbi:MAG: hypothetical protein ACK4QL_08105 [Pseudanabaenaceae cyanobacterium]